MPVPLQNWEPIWMDGDNKLTRENQLLWKACWRILQIRGRHQQWGSSLLPWCQFLTHTHTIAKNATPSLTICYMSCPAICPVPYFFVTKQQNILYSCPLLLSFTETTQSMCDQTEKTCKVQWFFLNKKESISILVQTQYALSGSVW